MGVGQSLKESIAADLAKAADLERRALMLRERAERSRVGLAGEVAVSEVVAPLARSGWVLLHDRRLPGSPANIDHLFVGPGAVVVVDAKNYAGRLQLCTDGQVLVNGQPRGREIAAVVRYASSVQSAVERHQPGVRVLPVVCFVRDVALRAPTQAKGVTLLQLEHLRPWLEQLDVVLEPKKVWALGEHLEKAHPPRVVEKSRARVSATRVTNLPAARIPAPKVTRHAHRASTRRTRPRSSVVSRFVLILLLLLVFFAALPTVVSHAVHHAPATPVRAPTQSAPSTALP